MQPYENIFALDRSGIERKAANTMSSGWTAAFFGDGLDRGADLWTFDSQEDRSQNFHAHNWAMLEPILAAHWLTGDEEYFHAALGVAEHWVHHFATDAARVTNVGRRQMAWYDMAVGLRGYRLAYLIDAGREGGFLSSGQDKELWDALQIHANYLADDANIKFHNNHGFYQAAGQLAMGRRFASRDNVMEKARRQGEKRFLRMLHKQFAKDGTHLEHSPDYHRMVYLTAKSVADAGLINQPAILSFLKKIEQALSWFILPSGHIANMGDSDSHQFHLLRQKARRQWMTPEMRYMTTRGKIGERPTARYAVFREGGYVAARIPSQRDGRFVADSYLLQQAGFHSRTHKHADTLSFIWSDRDHRILVDSGRYGYIGKTDPGTDLHKAGFWYSDPYRVYCESTRAHNCLEFDRGDYPRKGVEPFGSAVGRVGKDAGGKVHAFESEAEQFPGVRQVRLLFLCGSDWLICLDWFEDEMGRLHDVAQRFQLAPSIETRVCGDEAFEARLPREDTSLQICSLIDGVEAVDLIRGQREPRLQGWISRGFKKFEPTDSIAMHMTGKTKGLYATLFQFGDVVETAQTDSKVCDRARHGRLSWMADGRRHLLSFDRPETGPFKVSYSTQSSD